MKGSRHVTNSIPCLLPFFLCINIMKQHKLQKKIKARIQHDLLSLPPKLQLQFVFKLWVNTTLIPEMRKFWKEKSLNGA